MPVKDAEIHFSPHEGGCGYCGHPRLLTGAYPRGLGSHWFAYCPSCGQVHEQTNIPGWFGRDLPAPVGAGTLH